jgi:TolB-like protein
MLARAPDLSVVARNSSFTYKGKATDVRQIGGELVDRNILTNQLPSLHA